MKNENESNSVSIHSIPGAAMTDALSGKTMQSSVSSVFRVSFRNKKAKSCQGRMEVEKYGSVIKSSTCL